MEGGSCMMPVRIKGSEFLHVVHMFLLKVWQVKGWHVWQKTEGYAHQRGHAEKEFSYAVLWPCCMMCV